MQHLRCIPQSKNCNDLIPEYSSVSGNRKLLVKFAWCSYACERCSYFAPNQRWDILLALAPHRAQGSHWFYNKHRVSYKSKRSYNERGIFVVWRVFIPACIHSLLNLLISTRCMRIPWSTYARFSACWLFDWVLSRQPDRCANLFITEWME